MNNRIKSTAKTTETSFRVVDALGELDGATIDELSEFLGLAPSTVHRHIATLENLGYVVKNGAKYEIGLQFLTVGGYAQRGVVGYPIIKEKVDELAVETGERAQFIVEENGQRVYLYTEVGKSAVQTGAHIGKRGALHPSAAGKAIMAHLDSDYVAEIIAEQGLTIPGQDRDLDREQLFEQLEKVRERGYAFNRQETTKGVRAVGVAVTNADREVIGALSVSGPANRITGERFTESLPERILGAANELELQIEHSM